MERSAMDGVKAGAAASPGSLWPRPRSRPRPNTTVLLRRSPTGPGRSWSGSRRAHTDLRGTRSTRRRAAALPRGGQLPGPHRRDRGQRALVIDPGADQPGEQDRDQQSPCGGEEAETDAELTLYSEHEQQDEEADTPGHIPGPEREGRLRRGPPHRIDPVHLLIGTDPQS